MSLASTAVDPARIENLARSFGEEVNQEAVAGLVRFAALFLKWNTRINLGGVRVADELVDRHLSDAFAAVRFVASASRVTDVGSGGGLPAIPMALLRTEAEFDLFEPTAKKVAFLRTCVRELGIGARVRIHPSRLEAPCPPEFSGRFDVACSRATFAVADWLEVGRTLIHADGQVLVFGTGKDVPGLPTPAQEFVYAADRRLLIFSAL